MISAFLLLASFVLAPSAQDPDEPVHDGKWLYTRNCAGCHNDNGDGRGATILQLGLTARDFKQGGFAFGDTREQMMRTVSTGIPGRSPMPSFKGVLSDDEIGLVVDYVRSTLMPPRKDDRPKNTIMLVHDKPVIARGKLPPIADGEKDIPRGLLIGTPDGMTFEYDLDGVKLLAVRLGAFADREDWHDRGGGYLKPLGQCIYRRENDLVEWPVMRTDVVADGRPFQRVLKGTWVRGRDAGLIYDIVDHYGEALCRVEESAHAAALSTGAAFTRVWQVAMQANAQSLSIAVADAHDNAWRVAPRAKPADPSAPKQAWWTCDLGDEGVECVMTRSSKIVGFTPGAPALTLGVYGKPGEAVTLEATVIRVAKWSNELGEQLTKELNK